MTVPLRQTANSTEGKPEKLAKPRSVFAVFWSWGSPLYCLYAKQETE